MGSYNSQFNLQQAGAQASGFPSSPNAGTPSDRPNRPGPASAYTATAISTLPQLSPVQQQSTSSHRSTTSSHSYSRSSPAIGLDLKQMAHSTNPETPKYNASSSSKYYIPQTPTGAPSQSPLALSDIRPRVELNLSEDVNTHNHYLQDGGSLTQTLNSYQAPWTVYAYDWCNWPVVGGDGAGKMAICSYLEDPHNYIQILDTSIASQDMTAPGPAGYSLEFTRIAEATCSYPVTRILWEPPSTQKQTTDLLATSGDHLRLWSMPSSTKQQISSTITRSSSVNRKQSPPQKLTPLALLSNSKTPEHTAPLTSLDWNQLSPKLIITSSIDTTCTIWDIPTLTAKTQLIAHDKEVFDVRFCAGSVDTFVSCGADGSVRMFDLRSLEHSTIIYEPSEKNEHGNNSPSSSQHSLNHAPPLLRLAASPHDSHLLATFAQDSQIIRILDHRQPGQALLELHGHSGSLNCIEWSSSRRGMLASGGDDALVLCWDLINAQNSATISPMNGSQLGKSETGANVKGPASNWRCDYEVANISWCPQSQLTSQGGEWLGVTGGRGVWGVRL